MSSIKNITSTPITVPRSPTYHCVVPFHTASPATNKAPMEEEDEEEDPQRTVDVYMPDARMRYRCPRQHIAHKGFGDKMIICKTYSNAIEAGQTPKDVTACAMGNQCRFVHIDVPLNQLKGDIIHVHYIYRDAALCPYERLSTVMARSYSSFSEDTMLQIACPSGEDETEGVPISQIICTEGARDALRSGKRTPPSHCAHYYYAQTCNRGASCSFIHVVSVDPSQERDSTRPATYRKRMRQLGMEVSMNSFMFNASPTSTKLKNSCCTSPSTFSIHSLSTAAEKDINFCDVDSTPDDAFHHPSITRQNSFVSVGLSSSFKSLPVPKSTSPCIFLAKDNSAFLLPKDNDDSFITIRTTSTIIVPLEVKQPQIPKGRFVHNPYLGSCMTVVDDCI